MKGIIYARVSSVGQLNGYGIGRQIDCCLKYAKENKIDVISILTECESASDFENQIVRDFAVSLANKKTTKRSDCKILVESNDRWSRSGLSDPLSMYPVVVCGELEIDFNLKLKSIIANFESEMKGRIGQ
jgi:DNA invertase Pin-like site-specific DNA recombinase